LKWEIFTKALLTCTPKMMKTGYRDKIGHDFEGTNWVKANAAEF
jgi:hypothetical protein